MDSISLLLRANLESCLESYRRDKCGCSAASPHRSANAPGCQGGLATGTVLQRLTARRDQDRHSHTGGGRRSSLQSHPHHGRAADPKGGGGRTNLLPLPKTDKTVSQLCRAAIRRPGLLSLLRRLAPSCRWTSSCATCPAARSSSWPCSQSGREVHSAARYEGGAWCPILALSLHQCFKIDVQGWVFGF